jgi:hypothetical protein
MYGKNNHFHIEPPINIVFKEKHQRMHAIERRTHL